jgi:hypothetical protein
MAIGTAPDLPSRRKCKMRKGAPAPTGRPFLCLLHRRTLHACNERAHAPKGKATTHTQKLAGSPGGGDDEDDRSSPTRATLCTLLGVGTPHRWVNWDAWTANK